MIIILGVSLFTYRLVRDKAVIRAQRDKESTLLRSIGDGVIVIDRFWNVVLWNRRSEEITGWQASEVLGKPLLNFFNPIYKSSRKQNVTFIEHALVEGKPQMMANNTIIINKDGREVPVGDSAAPIFEHGKVVGAIIVFRDATQEQEAAHMKSDFTYASHQLNTPVTQVSWALELAEEEKTLDAMRDYVKTGRKALDSVKKLMSELIEVSNIDQDHVEAKFESVNLNEIFTDILEKIKKGVDEKKINLNLPKIPATASLTTDRKILSTLIEKILDNAILYSNEGGTVQITLEVKGEEILLRIEDQGVGIPDNDQTLVFTKFFRGSNFDTSKIAGAGLGLYVVEAYAKELGGKVWFESTVGKGSTFYLSLKETS